MSRVLSEEQLLVHSVLWLGLKLLANGGHSRRRGWILVEEVKSIQTTGQEGRGDGKVDECWVGWKRHV